MYTHLKHSLKNQSGASIIIALVFFLICAVVGSVVLTAASINAKAVATHQEMQQAEYTVSSAAQLIADQLVPAEVSCSGTLENITVDAATIPETAPDLMQEILTVWANRPASSTSALYELPEPLTLTVDGHEDLKAYAWVSFDRDCNITVSVSTSNSRTETTAYRQEVSVQSIPTFDTKGQVQKCQWEQAEITKA